MKNGTVDSQKLTARVTAASIAANIALSLIKILAGIFGHSTALISDAVHSLSDVFSSIVVLVGISISLKEPDEEHEYGHERVECIFAIVLAAILIGTGLMIGYVGVSALTEKTYLDSMIPGRITLYAAALSIVVKEIMFQVTKRAAVKIDSSAMMADAWHHRSDSLSSVGALIGVIGTRCGLLICEPIASIVICVMILIAGIEIFKDAADKLIDTSCSTEIEKQMIASALQVDGVKRVDKIWTRKFGSRIYVDVEIAADGTLTLIKAHEIAEKVHHRIETDFPGTKHCMVHVNPA